MGQDLSHLGVLLIPLLGRIFGGKRGGFVVVAQVAEDAADAHDQEHRQGGNLLAGEFQLVFGVAAGIGKAQAGGNGQHDGEKQGQQEALNGEHEDVLDNAGHGKQECILLAAHVEGVVGHIDRGLQYNIDEQIDGKAAQNHPGGGHLGTVEKQGEDHRAADLCQNEGEKVDTVRADDVAQYVRDRGADGSYDGAEDHGTQGVDKVCGIDAQGRCDGNGNLLHHQPQGDHQGGKDQHVGVFQLRGGITPIGPGKGVGIECGGFLIVGH